MKKTLLILGAVAFAFNASAASMNFVGKSASKDNDFADKCKEARRVNKRNAEKLYLPGTVSHSDWNDDRNTWRDPEVISFVYNPDGSVKSESTKNQREDYFYDEKGRLSEERDYSLDRSGKEKLESIKRYTYDPVIENLVVRVEYGSDVNNTDGWLGHAEGMEITRNSDGNIVKVREYSENRKGVKDYESEQMVIEYGTDGKACTIIEEEVEDNGRVIVDGKMTDIVWENTDGQIYQLDYDSPTSASYFGANRIKSSTIESEGFPYSISFTVDYTDDSFHSLAMMNNERVLEVEYQAVDENGSYDATAYAADYEYDFGVFTKEESSETTYVYRVDAYGIALEDSIVTVYYEGNFEGTENDVNKSEVTYDAVYGYPLEVIEMEMNDRGTFVNNKRIVYSDYAEYGNSGVSDVEIAEDSPVEFFNLQGQHVDNPSAGIFIRRQGTKTEKVLIP